MLQKGAKHKGPQKGKKKAEREIAEEFERKNPSQPVAMRAIWSGALSFGLVNIPVRLYSGSEERGLKLHYLHKEDLSPIRYARVCRQDGREIPYDDIVRGYEYQKGDS
jgi:hypothetical protein